MSPASLAPAGRFFTTEAPGKPTMEYYSAIKKNEIMPFAATWMDLESVILSEGSQTEKEKYHGYILELQRGCLFETLVCSLKSYLDTCPDFTKQTPV